MFCKAIIYNNTRPLCSTCVNYFGDDAYQSCNACSANTFDTYSPIWKTMDMTTKKQTIKTKVLKENWEPTKNQTTLNMITRFLAIFIILILSIWFILYSTFRLGQESVKQQEPEYNVEPCNIKDLEFQPGYTNQGELILKSL